MNGIQSHLNSQNQLVLKSSKPEGMSLDQIVLLRRHTIALLKWLEAELEYRKLTPAS